MTWTILGVRGCLRGERREKHWLLTEKGASARDTCLHMEFFEAGIGGQPSFSVVALLLRSHANLLDWQLPEPSTEGAITWG